MSPFPVLHSGSFLFLQEIAFFGFVCYMLQPTGVCTIELGFSEVYKYLKHICTSGMNA